MTLLERVCALPVARPWGGDGLPQFGLPPATDRAGRPVKTGEWWVECDAFPLLVKVIDAREDLSIQLHPGDADARALGLGDHGKTEAWYLLECRPGARILLGLADAAGVDRFMDAAAAGADVSPHLHTVAPRPGTFLMVPARTVHAIGAGCVLLEIQQRSDVTLRVFDWNREPRRELHLQHAAAVLRAGPLPALPAPATGLTSCAYFHAEARAVAPGRSARLTAGGERDELWFCARGKGVLAAGGSEVELVPGAFVRVRAEVAHVRAAEPLELVQLRAGPAAGA